MLSFIKKIFSSPVVKLGKEVHGFVSVLDTNKKDKKGDDLFSGIITEVDFQKRELTIMSSKSYWQKDEVHVVHFDKIVTISRMRDGRLRMWIVVED